MNVVGYHGYSNFLAQIRRSHSVRGVCHHTVDRLVRTELNNEKVMAPLDSEWQKISQSDAIGPTSECLCESNCGWFKCGSMWNKGPSPVFQQSMTPFSHFWRLSISHLWFISDLYTILPTPVLFNLTKNSVRLYWRNTESWLQPNQLIQIPSCTRKQRDLLRLWWK